MKKLFFICWFFAFNCLHLLANSGIYDNGIIIQVNGGTSTQYYFGAKCNGAGGGCAGSNSPSAPNFDGASAGAGVISLKIIWAEVRTFKNGGDNITGANLFYRVYPTAGSPPGFTQEGLSFGADISGGDQRWTESLNIEIVSGLMTSTNYTLEIYSTAPFTFTGGGGGSGTHFNNNGGSNFKMTFTTNSTFPVEMTRFDAKAVDKNVLLSWETASEHNNSHFEIQRSANTVNWDLLEKMPSHNGNASYVQSYAYTDEHPAKTVNYYRLRQVDVTGDEEYSKVVQVRLGSYADISVSPNPVGDVIRFQSEGEDREPISRVRVYDTFGRLLKEWNFENADPNQGVSLETSGLPTGVLLLRINDREAQRIVKY